MSEILALLNLFDERVKLISLHSKITTFKYLMDGQQVVGVRNRQISLS